MNQFPGALAVHEPDGTSRSRNPAGRSLVRQVEGDSHGGQEAGGRDQRRRVVEADAGNVPDGQEQDGERDHQRSSPGAHTSAWPTIKSAGHRPYTLVASSFIGLCFNLPSSSIIMMWSGSSSRYATSAMSHSISRWSPCRSRAPP